MLGGSFLKCAGSLLLLLVVFSSLKPPIKGVRQLKTAVLAKLEGLGMPRVSNPIKIWLSFHPVSYTHLRAHET